MPVRPTKLHATRELLARGTVRLTLNARTPEVQLPARFLDKSAVSLDIGYDLPLPIPDLVVDERGFTGTLSFGGLPFWCCVPWTAVFQIHSPERMLGVRYDEDFPMELQETILPPPTPPPTDGAQVISLDEYRARRAAKETKKWQR